MNEHFQPYDPSENEPIFSPEPLSPHPYTEPVKSKKKKSGIKIAALAICFSLLGSILGAGATLAITGSLGNTKPEENRSDALIAQREFSRLELNPVPTGSLMTPAEVYAANVNSEKRHLSAAYSLSRILCCSPAETRGIC